MEEYNLCKYKGRLYIIPCYSPLKPGDCIIDNVPGMHVVVQYEVDENKKVIADSDEIIFASDKYAKCKAEFNKLRAARKGKRIKYYIPALRMEYWY